MVKKKRKKKKGYTTPWFQDKRINYQKNFQQFDINSDRLLKSAIWQPPVSC